MTTPTPTAAPPTSPAVAWRPPRRPVVIVIAVLLAVVLACWALAWWGGINPSASAMVTETSPFSVAVEVTNDGQAPFEVEAVRFWSGAAPDGGFTYAVDAVEVAGGARARVVVPAPACTDGDWSSPSNVDVTVRSAVGTSSTFAAVNWLPVPCGR